MYGGVDQGDTARLAEIADEVFGEEPIDLVVDDCSHRYKLSHASFNELFPRLRPGGVYVIEDWPWAHAPVGTEEEAVAWSLRLVPLTRLVFEVILAIPGVPRLISGVEIDSNSVYVTRGEAEVDRETSRSQPAPRRGAGICSPRPRSATSSGAQASLMAEAASTARVAGDRYSNRRVGAQLPTIESSANRADEHDLG
jgi:hypothetical protein